MPKTRYPFKLHKFTSPTSDPKNIQKDIRELLQFITIKEQEIIDNAFTTAVERAMDDPDMLKGSSNRAGDRLGLSPTYTPEEKAARKHLYNLSEMVRANLASLVGSYAQRRNLFDVITELPDTGVEEIAIAYKELTGKTVTWAQVDKVLKALARTGSVDSLPRPPRKLPLWATDTHHCSLTQKGNKLLLRVKTNSGVQVLVFTVPHYVPLEGVKFTRPTIMLDHKGRLVFAFTAEKPVPAPDTPTGWLGVDLGVVKTYTATGATHDNHSQSWSDDRQIRELTSRIGILRNHLVRNKRKAGYNEKRYPERYTLQMSEARHLSDKITRLKIYRAHLVANKLIQIAKSNNLGIALENLSWVPNSHWEQSLVQTKIKDEATRHSVRVKKVSAKNTSKTCSNCGGLDTRFKNRTLVCGFCGYSADRDDNASLNIALRALRLKTAPPFFIRWQSRGTTEADNPVRVPFVDNTTTSTTLSLATIVRI